MKIKNTKLINFKLYLWKVQNNTEQYRTIQNNTEKQLNELLSRLNRFGVSKKDLELYIKEREINLSDSKDFARAYTDLSSGKGAGKSHLSKIKAQMARQPNRILVGEQHKGRGKRRR